MAIDTYYLQPQTQARELLKLVGGLRVLCSKYDIPALLERAAAGAQGDYGWSPEQAERDAAALRELATALEVVSK